MGRRSFRATARVLMQISSPAFLSRISVASDDSSPRLSSPVIGSLRRPHPPSLRSISHADLSRQSRKAGPENLCGALIRVDHVTALGKVLEGASDTPVSVRVEGRGGKKEGGEGAYRRLSRKGNIRCRRIRFPFQPRSAALSDSHSRAENSLP